MLQSGPGSKRNMGKIFRTWEMTLKLHSHVFKEKNNMWAKRVMVMDVRRRRKGRSKLRQMNRDKDDLRDC